LKQLKGIVTEWTVTYRDYIKDKNKGEYFIKVFWKIQFFLLGNFYHFTYIQTFAPANQKSRIEFNKHLFSTSKSFDNLFFEGKQALIDRLIFFYQQSELLPTAGYRSLSRPLVLWNTW
jgi:hypothetical protein